MSGRPATATDPFELVGQTLSGRFRVERQVAEGGFGVVYRCQQLVLDRAVALKVLRAPREATREQRAIFQRTFEAEARTIARLEHPNIVEVHDFGVTVRSSGEPLHWMALEWLEGRTLEALLEARRNQAPFDPAGALALMRPVFRAIGHAHRQGVVHRDLKPGNIFLVETEATTVVKVLDFGIAKIAASGRERAERPWASTTQGIPAFSPDYAAPEQISYARTGPWTDVHALGLVLGHMLTGQAPYSGGPASPFEAAMAERRPTPAARGVAVGAWEPVLTRALARLPDERYPDADALLAALEEALPDSGSSVGSSPPPRSAVRSAARSTSPAVRGRRAVAGAALLVALAAAAAGSRLVRPGAPPPRVMLAVLPFANLTGDRQQEYLADGLTQGMISQLGRLQPERLAVIARTSVAHYRETRKTVKEIGRELGVQYVLEGSMQRAGGQLDVEAQLIQVSDQTQVWGASYRRPMDDLLAIEGEVARAVAGQVRLVLTAEQTARLAPGRPRNPAAYDAYLKGEYFTEKTTTEGMRQAVDQFELAIRLDPTFAPAHAALGLATANLGVEELVPKARAEALRAIALDEGLPYGHNALAQILLMHDWDWAGAERHLRRALELDPNDAGNHHDYAKYLTAIGRHDLAIPEHERAVALGPTSLYANAMLGFAYGIAGQPGRAIAQLRSAIELDRRLPVPHIFLGVVYGMQGRFAEALAEAKTCEALATVAEEPSSYCVGLAGWIHARAGHTAEALAALETLRERARTTFVSKVDFANIHTALGRRDEAFSWLEKAYRERSNELIYLRVDLQLSPLRGDPRFTDLVRRVGIP